MHEKKPETYIVLESDGTICILEGNDKMNGKYERKGNTITLKLENGITGDFKIENDIIIGPIGERLKKE